MMVMDTDLYATLRDKAREHAARCGLMPEVADGFLNALWYSVAGAVNAAERAAPPTTTYDMDLRLCDDTGWVSDLPIEGESTADTSYLDRHNRLRSETRSLRGNDPETATERFMCTGSAHFLGQHFRCSSPAHLSNQPAEGRTGLDAYRP